MLSTGKCRNTLVNEIRAHRLIKCGPTTLESPHIAVAFSHLAVQPQASSNIVGPFQHPDMMAFPFCDQFAGLWEASVFRSTFMSGSERVTASLEEHGQQCCIVTYHMRVFTPSRLRMHPPALPGNRIVLDRTRGTVTAPINRKAMHVAEKRLAVAVKSTTTMDLPIFSIVNLTDIADTNEYMEPLAGNNWEAAGIQPWRGGAGLAAFAMRIQMLCGLWAKEWTRTLDELDGLLTVDVRLPSSIPNYSKSRPKR